MGGCTMLSPALNFITLTLFLSFGRAYVLMRPNDSPVPDGQLNVMPGFDFIHDLPIHQNVSGAGSGALLRTAMTSCYSNATEVLNG